MGEDEIAEHVSYSLLLDRVAVTTSLPASRHSFATASPSLEGRCDRLVCAQVGGCRLHTSDVWRAMSIAEQDNLSLMLEPVAGSLRGQLDEARNALRQAQRRVEELENHPAIQQVCPAG